MHVRCMHIVVYLSVCLSICIPAVLLEEQSVHVSEAVFCELHPDRYPPFSPSSPSSFSSSVWSEVSLGRHSWHWYYRNMGRGRSDKNKVKVRERGGGGGKQPKGRKESDNDRKGAGKHHLSAFSTPSSKHLPWKSEKTPCRHAKSAKTQTGESPLGIRKRCTQYKRNIVSAWEKSKDRGKKEKCYDCTLDTLALHSGGFKLNLGATGLTEIIRAGGASSNLQSRAKGERSRVCPSSKAEKIGGLIKSTNT